MFQKCVCQVALLVVIALVQISMLSEAVSAEDPSPTKWELQTGDRVVLLGNTFIERENSFGMIELSLRLTHPELEFSCRNLGWAGDNVFGESRAYFGPVQQGYAHIQEFVNLLDPTVVLVSYGHNAAFEGESAKENFLKNYARLLDDISKENRRIVVLGLTPLEAIYRTEEETKSLNEMRQEYCKAIAAMCEEKNLVYVDLFESLLGIQQKLKLPHLTDNGVHLNRNGYLAAGEAIANSTGKSLIVGEESLLRDSQFQAVIAPVKEQLLWKSELFFHRFRPQNETYLRGFRKHEQGQNAKEIYEFDELVAAADKKLNELTRRAMQTWDKN